MFGRIVFVVILVLGLFLFPGVAYGADPVDPPEEKAGWILFNDPAKFFRDLYNGVLGAIGESVRSVLDVLLGLYLLFVSGLGQFLAAGFGTISNFFNSFWAELTKWYTFITGIRDAVQWFMDFCKDAYKFCEDFIKWLCGTDDGFGQWLWETIQNGLTWLGDFFKQLWERAQNFIFDNGLWLYEWVVGILDDCIAYFINLIHKIFEVTGINVSLPDGAEGAIIRFFEWGMFFNDFLPIKELFQLLGVYLMFLVMMSLVRFIKSMIPFVG